MINQIDNPQNTINRKSLIGYVLLGLGAAILLKQTHLLFFPGWLISWPIALIVYGLYIGAKHDFKKSNWILFTMIGVIFLLPNIIPALGISLWPLLLIAIGVNFLIRRNHHWNGANWEKRTEDTNSSNYHNFDNTAQ
jgi:hypothetical protein